ncbi:MAG: DUF4982 domain-containing protein [Treponema sp.]|jgi:hypothetical protein|nr:DUF4982 domain-containing protein [Treponema sp.]
MKIVNLRDWKFSLASDRGAGDFDSLQVSQSGFDDHDWKDVCVPHDWAVSFPFFTACSSGTGYLPGGTGWYRREFRPPEGWKGKRAFVCFDGVYKNSQVWCNGYYLGKRPSGYAGFRYDISHCLRDGDNVLAVKVSHEDIADSRWYTGSGIYRKVCLHFYDRFSIDESSLFLRAAYGDHGAALRISGTIMGPPCHGGSSTDALPARLLVKAFVTGDAGELYTLETIIAAPAAGGAVSFEAELRVPSPRLWSPETPYLYTFSLELYPEGGGEAVSRMPPLKTGFRTITFDPDTGFFLNGRSLKIKGVCLHHDAGCLGAAVWPDVWRRRLEKLKEMGCNAIRTSHNPHMGELYDLCDEMGFLVMDEAFDEWEGCKNKWTRGHNVYPPVHQGYSEDFPEWHERDLADMVIRDRNHPCVIMWSIGNEIDYPNDPYTHPEFTEMTGNNDAGKPKEEMMFNQNKPNMERLASIAAKLTAIVKRHDPTRPVLLAAAFPELSSRLGIFDTLDIVGYNYKEDLYEAHHRSFPKLPILGSENGHGAAEWKAARDKDYVSAQFLWTGIDFLGEAKGWPQRCSGSGLLDTAGYEKIAYFRRKSLWSDGPVLYLATRPDAAQSAAEAPGEIQPWELFRSWDYQPQAHVQVVCYTNLAEAELFLNGKSFGIGRPHEEYGYLCWTLPFERGTLKVSGIGVDASDTLQSTLPAVLLRVREWRSAGGKTGDDSAADGGYRIAQVEVEALDQNNCLCTAASNMVHVSVTGPGKLLGIENGDIADCDAYAAPRRRLYRGRLIVYVLIKTGVQEKVSLAAFAEGIPLRA